MRLKSVLLFVWDLMDPLFFACTRLSYVGHNGRKNSLFRVRLTCYKGRRVFLSDGTIIQKGDFLLKIHLHNVAVLQDMLHLRNEVKKAKYLYRRVEKSLPELAYYLNNHLRSRDIKGIVGVTMLNRGCRSLGFETFPIHSSVYKWFKYIGQLPIHLLSAGQPFKSIGKHFPAYLFMSKENLVNKYGRPQDNPREMTREKDEVLLCIYSPE